ncbi:tetratricopeptide repeat protein [Paraburkholderia hospita]|uniref:tetratricopeptide repeat protein n=1 Tax=Paraburkholderia hospita TaxID=169430 RepID=UPI003B75CE35
MHEVAQALNERGVLYKDTQRLTEAESAFREALDIYRNLAEANPSVYGPDVTLTLNNLAAL